MKDMGKPLLPAAVLTVAMLLTGCPEITGVVFFRDDGLELSVRRALHKPLGLVTKADLLRLESLDARDVGIRDLTGLEHAVNMSELNLAGNRISSIKILANLTELEVLNLDSNEVSDLTPLAGLLNLRSLSLFDNPVADIQPLVTNALNGGLGFGDSVVLDIRTLSNRALETDIPILEKEEVNVVLVEPQS